MASDHEGKLWLLTYLFFQTFILHHDCTNIPMTRTHAAQLTVTWPASPHHPGDQSGAAIHVNRRRRRTRGALRSDTHHHPPSPSTPCSTHTHTLTLYSVILLTFSSASCCLSSLPSPPFCFILIKSSLYSPHFFKWKKKSQNLFVVEWERCAPSECCGFVFHPVYILGNSI